MNRRFCKPVQVWWANLDPTVGSEQRGVRPVYIAHKFSQNLIWVFPLTSRKKEGDWYLPFLFGGQSEPESFVVLSQSRTIDAKQLMRKMGKASLDQFAEIKEAFISMISKVRR